MTELQRKYKGNMNGTLRKYKGNELEAEGLSLKKQTMVLFRTEMFFCECGPKRKEKQFEREKTFRTRKNNFERKLFFRTEMFFASPAVSER